MALGLPWGWGPVDGELESVGVRLNPPSTGEDEHPPRTQLLDLGFKESGTKPALQVEEGATGVFPVPRYELREVGPGDPA